MTAREMYNLARAAEAGWQGTVNEARDFELVSCALEAPGGSPNQAPIGKSLSDYSARSASVEP